MKTLTDLFEQVINKIDELQAWNKSVNFDLQDGAYMVDIFADCDNSMIVYTPSTYSYPPEASGYYIIHIRADWFDEEGERVKSEEITEKHEV